MLYELQGENFSAIDSRKSFDLACGWREEQKKGLKLILASLKLLISVEVTAIFPLLSMDYATHFLLFSASSRFMAFFFSGRKRKSSKLINENRLFEKLLMMKVNIIQLILSLTTPLDTRGMFTYLHFAYCFHVC